MSGNDARTVLVVVGDPTRSELVSRALRHPALSVQVASNEQDILATLKDARFDLAVVGGRIGRRDPLVTCEAVRVRQPGLSVLVLVGDETDVAALHAHQERRLDGVTYAILGPTWDQAQTTPQVEIGQAIRQEVLSLMSLTEDPESQQAWIADHMATLAAERTQVAQSGPATNGSPGPVLLSGEVTPSYTSEEHHDMEEDVTAVAEPPSEKLTDEDFAFAKKVIEQTRNVDFRQPLSSTKPPDGAGAERTVHLLREKVRELERNLARLACVYAQRAWTFDAADEQLRDLTAAKTRIETDLARLRAHLDEENERAQRDRADRDAKLTTLDKTSDELRARVVELTSANSQLTKEIERREAARVEMERNFGAVLKQAQDAFATLRDQSAQSQTGYERQLEESRQQAQAAQADIAGLKQEIASLRAQLKDAATEAPQLEQAATTERAAFMTEKRQWLEQQTAMREELAQARSATEQERAKASAVERDLERFKGEAQRLQQEVQRNAALLATAHENATAEKEALEHKWLGKFEQIRDSIQNLRATYASNEAALRTKETELVAVQTKLQTRDEEINELQKAHRDVTDALARERVGFAEAMEAKLDALERFSRETSERMVRLVEALAALDQLARRQEVLTEKLLSRSPTMSLPEPSRPQVAYSLATDPAIRQLEREADPGHGQAGWAKLDAKHSRLFFFAVGGTVLLLLAVSIGWMVWPRQASAPVAPQKSRSAEQVLPADGAGSRTRAVEAKVPPTAKAPTGATDTKPAAQNEAKTETGESEIPVAAAPTVPAKPITPAAEAERKVLRQDLMVAFKKKHWADAIKAGTKMRDSFPMDWEAEFTLARAQQAAGKAGDAAETFLAFTLHFPTNKFVGDASLAAARILAQQGKNDQARSVLQRLAEDKDAGVRAKAKEALNQLGNK